MKSYKECPFCGFNSVCFSEKEIKNTKPKQIGYQIECINCAAKGPIYGDKKSAMLGWNLGEYGHSRTIRKDDPQLLRLPDVLRLFPVSKTSWYRGIENGLYPEPVEIAQRTVAWRIEDINELIKKAKNKELICQQLPNAT